MATSQLAKILSDFGTSMAKILVTGGYNFNLNDIVYDKPKIDVAQMSLTEGVTKVLILMGEEIEYDEITNVDMNVRAMVQIFAFINRDEEIDSTLLDRQQLLNLGRDIVSGFHQYMADIKSGAATNGDAWDRNNSIRQSIVRAVKQVHVLTEFELTTLDTI